MITLIFIYNCTKERGAALRITSVMKGVSVVVTVGIIRYSF